MLSSPVYAKLQPRTDPSSARTHHATISPFLIHPLCFHIHPHSFAQWTAPISLSFNRFRTLSIVMGGGGIPIAKSLNHHFNCAPSPHATPIHQNRPRPFVSTTYKLPIFYLLCFDIHPCNGGVGWGSPVKSLKKNFNCPRISTETTSLPRKMRHNRRAVPNFTGHELRNTDHASVPYLVSSFRLFCDTLCRWEFCGGSHAGWEHKTT